MAKKLKINENFKSRGKRRFQDVSKKRRIRLIARSFYFKRSRTTFAFRWKLVDGFNCFKIFKRQKKVPLLVNFQTSKFVFVWVCLPFDLLTANNFEIVKSVIYTLKQTWLTLSSIWSFHELLLNHLPYMKSRLVFQQHLPCQNLV